MRRRPLNDAERHSRTYGSLTLLAGNTAGLKADLRMLRIEPGTSTSYHRHYLAESLFHVLDEEIV